MSFLNVVKKDHRRRAVKGVISEERKRRAANDATEEVRKGRAIHHFSLSPLPGLPTYLHVTLLDHEWRRQSGRRKGRQSAESWKTPSSSWSKPSTSCK
eukprot:1158794-Pelagomonas_calceolata.AAC.5